MTSSCLHQEESQRPLVALVHALASLLGSMCFPTCGMSLKNPLASLHDRAAASVEVLLRCVSTRGPPGAL